MVGTDIIEVDRIEKLIKEKNEKFLNRIYTKKEIDYCESKGPSKYQYYAGRFAAKEAVFKILSIHLSKTKRPLIFKDIEILNREDGVPYINIHNNVMVAYLSDLNISISHIKKYAIAVAINV